MIELIIVLTIFIGPFLFSFVLSAYDFIKGLLFDNPKEIKKLKKELDDTCKQLQGAKETNRELEHDYSVKFTAFKAESMRLADNLEFEYDIKYKELKSLYYQQLDTLTNRIDNPNEKNFAKIFIDNALEEFLFLSETQLLSKYIPQSKSSFTNRILLEEIQLLKNKLQLLESESNLTAIPYMAQIIADFETYDFEYIAKKLEWGTSQERLKKVKSIRDLRNDAKAMVEKNKEAQYQLSYLMKLFPELEDIIECEFKSLPHININLAEDRDVARDYLSKEEYIKLSTTERNQLALDRYLNSHNKSKWQIGRDYEQFVGYKYTLDGYYVDNFGTYKGLEDLGRDIIAKKGNKTLIIQCKYWSSLKLIHEKHITQLYGTMMSYCIENNISEKNVSGVLVTNIKLSDTAKEFAKRLHIEYIEDLEMGNYPCIKCNVGATGEKIYHLPFDQQYDATKIESHKGEFYALTVKEAEDAGFRRAHKHFGS